MTCLRIVEVIIVIHYDPLVRRYLLQGASHLVPFVFRVCARHWSVCVCVSEYTFLRLLLAAD